MDLKKAKLLQKLLYGMFIGWLPFGVIIHFLSFGSEIIFGLLASSYLIAWAIVGIALFKFVCPNCNERYFRFKSGLFRGSGNLWALKCIHCKWSIWEERKE